MMSRVKHLTTLIMKLVFLTLVCAATMVMSAMQSVSTDEISIAKDFDENSIDVLTENGATVTWEVVDGELEALEEVRIDFTVNRDANDRATAYEQAKSQRAVTQLNVETNQLETVLVNEPFYGWIDDIVFEDIQL